MTRGTIFEISDTIEDLFSMTETELYDALGRSEFDYLSDIDDPSYVITALLERFKMAGMTIGLESDGDLEIPYFILDVESKKRYFKDCFEKFKSFTQDLTLDDFATKSQWELKMLINDEYGDAVASFGYGTFITLDAFVREAKPGKYFIGKTFLMH